MLWHIFSPIPFSFATGDGKRRETWKSKLIALIVERIEFNDPTTDNFVKEIKKDGTFVIELIATIWAMNNLSNTYEEFVWHFVSTLLKGF